MNRMTHEPWQLHVLDNMSNMVWDDIFSHCAVHADAGSRGALVTTNGDDGDDVRLASSQLAQTWASRTSRRLITQTQEGGTSTRVKRGQRGT